MPGFLVHVGATVQCSHLAPAQPMTPNPRVLVSSQPTVTMASQYSIAACPFNVGGSPSPCVTAQFTTGATRVFSNGQPLVLSDSQAMCAPNATPLVILLTQIRVTAI